MFSKREREAYLEIGGGAGISFDLALRAGRGTLAVEADRKLQLATVRCAHCPRQVVFNPLRTRSRGECSKCDRYLCDTCALEFKLNGGICNPLEKQFDNHLARIAREQNYG